MCIESTIARCSRWLEVKMEPLNLIAVACDCERQLRSSTSTHWLLIHRNTRIRDPYTCRPDSFLGCCDRNPCSISWQTFGQWIFSSASNGQWSRYSRRSSLSCCHAVAKLQVTAFVLDRTCHRAHQRMVLHIFLLDGESIFRNLDIPGPTRVICHEYDLP
jgi:hypothetical protein